MIDWIARNWRDHWLGSFVWWQSVAALLQASFAVALYVVTRRYVKLTKTLTEAQVTQIRLMQQATKRELYERRLKVFLSTMDFLSNFVTHVKVEIADIQKFSRATLEAEFLFDKDVLDLLDKIRISGLDHRTMSVTVEQIQDPEKQHQMRLDVLRLENWLCEEAFSEAKLTFRRYLSLTDSELEALLPPPA